MLIYCLSYRVNVFGFPNAKGLTDQNVGLLDQRLAYVILYSPVSFISSQQWR